MKSDSLFWGCCFPQLATVQFACGTEATVCSEAEDEKALGYHTLSALYGLPGNSPGGIKTNVSTVLGAYREAPIYVLRSKADCSFNNILSAIILIIGLTKKKKKKQQTWGQGRRWRVPKLSRGDTIPTIQLKSCDL